jgi:hypothetical protein
MDTNNVRALKKGDIFAAKIRSAKINSQWQPPQLILSVVEDIYRDAEGNPVARIIDAFIPLQQRDDINLVVSTGIGPRIGIPNNFVKADAQKAGPMFKRATVWDDVAKRYTDVPLGSQFTKIQDGHRINADFSSADRVELKLTPVFDRVVEMPTYRIGQVRDATADGGWRPAAPWVSQFPRAVELDGETVDAQVVHQTVKITGVGNIVLDRAPRNIEAAAPTADIGETL